MWIADRLYQNNCFIHFTKKGDLVTFTTYSVKTNVRNKQNVCFFRKISIWRKI